MFKTRFLSAVIVTAVLSGGVLAPAQAASKSYTVKVKLAGAQGKTVLLIAKSGRVLARQAVTQASQQVSLRTPVVANISGSSLQLVTTAGGDYFGPVVLGWASKSKVYTAIKSTSTTTNYGKVVVRAVTAKQGYGKASANKKRYSDSVKWTAASNYKPVGVGTYGKAAVGSRRSAIGSSLVLRGAVSGPVFAATGTDTLAGADTDGDGIPNTFDVNDNGNSIIDSADPLAVTPMVGASCEAGATFNIFTNFKATDPNFSGTINAYGTNAHEATSSSITNAWSNTLSMVIQPVRNVCGENVVKTEFMGVGIPYAPSSFVDIGSPGFTGDFQWTIGNGQVSGTTIDALPTNRGAGQHGWTFALPTEISALDTFLQQVTTTSGKTYVFAGTAGFVFVTHPLPIQYKISSSAISDVSTISSWDNQFMDGSGSAIHGDGVHPITVGTNDYLYLQYYRPQRLAIDGETAGFYDLAGFSYTPDIPNPIGGGGNGPGRCDAQQVIDTAMTTDMAVVTSGTQPTMVIGWKLSDCFNGSDANHTWKNGSLTVDIQVMPQGPGGNSAQKLFVTAAV